ncbi:hypothetical protein [Sphingomicrobium flavum]|uniref:hypothetical protein n=1 Tax=Sphingomicrobium flavum TaxID=1229164 RepID=UPI0021AD7B18|nr:hypothetical protein [Sphingomicrobium flavum]
MSDPLVERAMEQMRELMAEGRLEISDIERFQLLLKQSRRRRASGKVRIELIRFVGELMSRRGSSPGASPLPAPVFPHGGPPPLAGAAEAPLD